MDGRTGQKEVHMHETPVFPCPHCGSRQTELCPAGFDRLPGWLRRLLPGVDPHPLRMGRVVVICKSCGKRHLVTIM